MKTLGYLLVFIGSATALCAVPAIPEIDPGSGASALALLSGLALIVRARTKAK